MDGISHILITVYSSPLPASLGSLKSAFFAPVTWVKFWGTAYSANKISLHAVVLLAEHVVESSTPAQGHINQPCVSEQLSMNMSMQECYYLEEMSAIQSSDQLFICHGRETQAA